MNGNVSEKCRERSLSEMNGQLLTAGNDVEVLLSTSRPIVMVDCETRSDFTALISIVCTLRASQNYF